MGILGRSYPKLTGGLAALALLAIALRVLCPPGFMISETRGSTGLVICTGHGALDLSHPSGPAHGKTSTPEAPCAFSGHAAAPPPATPTLALATAFTAVAPAATLLKDLFPGRGLAAPPPPSQGPPKTV